MSYRLLALAGAFLGLTGQLCALTLDLRRSPLLEALLPTGTTFQVEHHSNGSWTPLGVMIAGTGSSNVVRLDGFPSSGMYRLSQVGGSTIVSPNVAYGLHLNASAPDADEVRIETSSTLNVWTHDSYCYPDINGSWIRPLRPPLATKAFFRALVPAQTQSHAVVTHYSADPSGGTAGFGAVLDDMPAIYRDGYIAAACPDFYNRDGKNATAAGECYQLAGSSGTVTVMIADLAPDPPAGTCDGDTAFFDLNSPAWPSIFPAAQGIGLTSYRLVPAPVTGNVKMAMGSSSSEYYFELLLYNHRAGISKVEIRGPVSGGTAGVWTELPRQLWNSFVYSGSPAGFPLEVRATSRFGEVVDFPPLTSIAGNSRHTANAQFEIFPTLEPTPVWTIPPVYTDGLSTAPGTQWTLAPWGGLTADTAYTSDAFTGTASLRLTNLTAWSGIGFLGPSFQLRADSFLEFAAKSTTSAGVSNLVVYFSGSDALGTPVQSARVSLPTIGPDWRVFQIPLNPAGAPVRVESFTLMNQSGTTQPSLLLDAVSIMQR